ncbi:uncharacterized protein LOC144153345 [Haemaphysalis longicornis]
MEITTDQAALTNTLSSSGFEYVAEDAPPNLNDRPALYDAVDILRMVPPLPPLKPQSPSRSPSYATPSPQADRLSPPVPQVQRAQADGAAVGLTGTRVFFWLCAVAVACCYGAVLASVAMVMIRSNDELSRSMGEARLALKYDREAFDSSSYGGTEAANTTAPVQTLPRPGDEPADHQLIDPLSANLATP